MPKQKKTQSHPKPLYRVKNWSDYEIALVQRGSITFWLSDDFEQTWLYAGEKQRGSQFDHSDQAIDWLSFGRENKKYSQPVSARSVNFQAA